MRSQQSSRASVSRQCSMLRHRTHHRLACFRIAASDVLSSRASLLPMKQLMNRLHIDVEGIAAQAGVSVHKINFRGANVRHIVARACGCPVSELSGSGVDCALLEKNVGLVTASDGVPHIFIHRCAVADRRWVCAHELGHYLLGHVGKDPPPEELKTTPARQQPTGSQHSYSYQHLCWNRPCLSMAKI